ncbi:MAG: SurA N-terminal domain-containing protein [Gammaproteobacteria bacterium]|nr:SurA N-terminal domain-containing protein [Gammaproteobacteria bacterium]MDH3769143.1 SurA N-terminal domain-containing protein [Gammaproteobacteria bacterium]
MLQSIRDNLNGWVAGLLFIVIGLAFALWGVPNTITGSAAAAEVNGEEIPLDEIRRAYRNQLLQFQQYSDISPEQEKVIQTQVLQGLVIDEVLSQHTRESGYHIGNEALVGHIRNMQEFQDQGQFSLELFHSRLAPQGFSPQYFEAQVRRALRISQLRRGIIDTSFITQAELAQRARLEREQRSAEWFQLPVNIDSETLVISDEDIEAHYTANSDQFMQPESVDLAYVALNLSDLAAATTVTEADLNDYYTREVAQGRFQAPEERQASHILIAVDTDTDDAAANEQAQALIDRLRGGADFAALAGEFSDDPGSGPEGGDLGWAQRTAYVGAFADALFSMEADELRGPIRTQFGYHIIRMEGQRGGVPKLFEEVSTELREELSRNLAEDEFYDISEQMADLGFENPDTLDPIAEELSLEIVRMNGVARTGGEGLVATPAVIDAAFSERVLQQGENSDTIDVGTDSRVILRVEKHSPATVRPLAEVVDNIRTILRTDAAQELVFETGKTLIERIRGGEAITDLAGEFEAEHHAQEAYRRTAALPPLLRDALFQARKPDPGAKTVDGVVLADGSYAVFALAEVTPGDTANLGAPDTVASQQGIGDLTAYVLQLRDDASVTLRPELLQQ